MQSFILVSKSPELQENYLSNLFAKEGIDAFDTTIIEPEVLKSEKEGSIGIKEVRILQETIALMPRKGKYRAVVFKNADSLTVQAQNALLKTFEEPPPHTLIFVLVDNEQQLLPTIRSRCTIVKLDVILGTNGVRTPESPRSWASQDDNQHAVSALEKLTVQQALLLAQAHGKNQQAALTWINSTIISLRHELINNIQQSNNSSISLFLNILVSLQKASVDIQTSNVNPRFALETHLLQQVR